MIINIFPLLSKALDIAVEKFDSKDSINAQLHNIYKQFKSCVNDLPVAQLNYLSDQMEMAYNNSMDAYSKNDNLDELKLAEVYQKFQRIIASKLESLKEYGKEYEL